MWKSEFRQNYRTISHPQFHLSLLGYLASRRRYRHLAAKVGTSKHGGKQWQTTPKNLPRMQCARSHTGHMTGLWFLPARPLRLNTNEWMKSICTDKATPSNYSVLQNATKSATLTEKSILLLEKWMAILEFRFLHFLDFDAWRLHFKYRVIQNDCRGFNNLSYTIHLVLQMQSHVISFYGVTSRIRFMFLLFPQVSRNWRLLHATNSLEQTQLSCWCL